LNGDFPRHSQGRDAAGRDEGGSGVGATGYKGLLPLGDATPSSRFRRRPAQLHGLAKQPSAGEKRRAKKMSRSYHKNVHGWNPSEKDLVASQRLD